MPRVCMCWQPAWPGFEAIFFFVPHQPIGYYRQNTHRIGSESLKKLDPLLASVAATSSTYVVPAVGLFCRLYRSDPFRGKPWSKAQQIERLDGVMCKER